MANTWQLHIVSQVAYPPAPDYKANPNANGGTLVIEEMNFDASLPYLIGFGAASPNNGIPPDVYYPNPQQPLLPIQPPALEPWGTIPLASYLPTIAGSAYYG